jgi:hypothetical protein
MVEDILPETSSNLHEIIREAHNFGEYLESVKGGLASMRGAG